MKPKNKKQCMFPKCILTEKSRGLCQRHYQTAYLLVKAGEKTWEIFENAGISAPSKAPVKTPLVVGGKEYKSDADYMRNCKLKQFKRLA